ncbi:hypothetical protein EDB84DRAFT_1560828 [Lactarius hengduanensis]|nr:hypothetical protein EDB84DRAFT_1560828 [Lactarius hengduanensis]
MSVGTPDYRPRVVQANSWRFRPRERNFPDSIIYSTLPSTSGKTHPMPVELRFLNRLVEMSYGHFGPCTSAQPPSIGCVESAQDSISIRAGSNPSNPHHVPGTLSAIDEISSQPSTPTILSDLGASTGHRAAVAFDADHRVLDAGAMLQEAPQGDVRRLGPVVRAAFEFTYVQMEVAQVRKRIRYVRDAAQPADDVQRGRKRRFTQDERLQGRKGDEELSHALSPSSKYLFLSLFLIAALHPREGPNVRVFTFVSESEPKPNARALGTENTTSPSTTPFKRSGALLP